MFLIKVKSIATFHVSRAALVGRSARSMLGCALEGWVGGGGRRRQKRAWGGGGGCRGEMGEDGGGGVGGGGAGVLIEVNIQTQEKHKSQYRAHL